MSDIKLIKENPEAVKENIRRKFKDAKLPLVDEAIALYDEKLASNKRADELRGNRNRLSKQIGMLMGQGKREEAEEIKAQVSAQAKELAELEQKEADLQVKLNKIAAVLEESVDIDGLLELARTAPALEYESASQEAVFSDARIAVAYDDAFCFYYSDTLRLLERLGAQLVRFSPLSDAHLPDGTCGLYMGGGYPELYAQSLAENTRMKEDTQTVNRRREATQQHRSETGGTGQRNAPDTQSEGDRCRTDQVYES